jgi:hypothetical protein
MSSQRNSRDIYMIGPNRSFGLILAAASAALGVLAYRAGGGRDLFWGALATFILLIALILPRVLAPARVGWLKLGHRLSWLINPLILGIVYIIVIIPISAVMRLFRRDPMARRYEAAAASYWIKRGGSGWPDDLKEQF